MRNKKRMSCALQTIEAKKKVKFQKIKIEETKSKNKIKPIKMKNERKEIVMLERVKEIIEEQLNIEGVEITEETRFKEDLDADSLDLFELVDAFQEEYGVEIPPEDLEQLTTVGAIIKYMQDKGVEA